jgi:hypothetical protein
MTIQHVDGTLARHRMSKDHILPRHWGGGGVGKYARNTRWICQECNNHRAACGHCVGALACVQQVASESCISVSAVLRRWKMGKVAALIVVPGSGVPKQTFRKPSPMEVEHAE